MGKNPEFVSIDTKIEQRKYFSFYNYEYALDVSIQKAMLKSTISLEEGLRDSYKWYVNNSEQVKKKDFKIKSCYTSNSF